MIPPLMSCDPEDPPDNVRADSDLVAPDYWPKVRAYMDSLSFPEQVDDDGFPEVEP